MKHLHVVQVFSQESIEELTRVSHNSCEITVNTNKLHKNKTKQTNKKKTAKYGQLIYSKPVKLTVFITNQSINVI